MVYLIIIVILVVLGLFYLMSILTNNSNSVVIENSDDSFYEEEHQEELQKEEVKEVKDISTDYHEEVKETPIVKEEVFIPKKEVNLNIESDIRNLLSQGKKIKAIKLYREYYNVGLKEAKDAVEEIAASQTGIEINRPSDSQIRDLVSQGQKIQAIKLYRELYKVDLKTAYEEINKMS